VKIGEILQTEKMVPEQKKKEKSGVGCCSVRIKIEKHILRKKNVCFKILTLLAVSQDDDYFTRSLKM